MLWMGVTLVPLLVVFGTRASVAGWSFPEMLVVLGWFVAPRRACWKARSALRLMQVVEHVRKGTLDFVLLKPVDAQLLVSLSKLEPWRVVDLAGAGVIFAIAFGRLGRAPSLGDVLLAALLLCAAVLVLYSIAILVVSIAFVAVRVDNLLYLFQSVFDVARWPNTRLPRRAGFLFTFVLPLALMTTYPSLALLGKLNARTAAGALAGSLALRRGGAAHLGVLHPPLHLRELVAAAENRFAKP